MSETYRVPPFRDPPDKLGRVKPLESLRLYTLSEIAPILGVTRPTLMKYINEGRLHATKIGGTWKVSEENLRRLIEGKW